MVSRDSSLGYRTRRRSPIRDLTAAKRPPAAAGTPEDVAAELVALVGEHASIVMA
jgi:hypothetical protein